MNDRRFRPRQPGTRECFVDRERETPTSGRRVACGISGAWRGGVPRPADPRRRDCGRVSRRRRLLSGPSGPAHDPTRIPGPARGEPVGDRCVRAHLGRIPDGERPSGRCLRAEAALPDWNRLVHRVVLVGGPCTIAPLPRRLAGDSRHRRRYDDRHGPGDPRGHVPRGEGAQPSVRGSRLDPIRGVRRRLYRGRPPDRGVRMAIGHVRQRADRSRGDDLGSAIHRAERSTCGVEASRHPRRGDCHGRVDPPCIRVHDCRDRRPLHDAGGAAPGTLRPHLGGLLGHRIPVEGAAHATGLPAPPDDPDRERCSRSS